jgi:prepilin-type N-terminal cleavage/methylation domain-containing protein
VMELAQDWITYWLEEFPMQMTLLPNEWKWLLIAVMAGIVGSFINMAMWRIPNRRSLLFPRSYCPSCEHILSVKDLVPILSFVFLRGKCAYCGRGIGIRYVLVETFLVTEALGLYLWLGFNSLSLCLFLGTTIFIFLGGVFFSLKQRAWGQSGPRGFTYIEVMLALVIVATIIVPFGNVFLSSYGRVLKNKEYIMAYNLMEEKLEELKLVSFSRLRSDYRLYALTEKREDSIFVDEHVGFYHDLKTSSEKFQRFFSDIQTEDDHLPSPLFKKFKKTYEAYYRRSYEYYPVGYQIFKRTVQIEIMGVKRDAKFKRQLLGKESKRDDLLKITVTLWIDSATNQRKLEMSTYRRR